MKFEGIKSLSDEEFWRLTGVKKATFEKMVEILKVSDSQKKKRGGRPNKLNIEDQ
ncbi:MAG: IS5/IS1182 family transposase, partial [Holosporaceae bacterium]|nr:IS5/IS1182 family transposase [Holosporaceae bacterium]